MKHNNFSFLVGEGTKAIFKHGFMSFAAVCITVACLVIVTSFGLITYNIGLIVDDLQKENEVLICIDESYTEAEAKSVGSRINLIDNVADARFISREEALQTFVKEYDAVMYDGVTAETMRDQYIVTLEDNSKLQETIDALKQVPGVATIYSDPTVANAMSTIRNVLSIVSACIAAVLLIVSLIIISNTIKLAMFDRREEIAIMRMVGATNGFIRWPFVYEGFMLGLTGAILAFLLQWGLYEAIAQGVANNDTLQLLSIVPFQQLWKPVGGVFLGAGILIGVGGSLSAIRRFLQV
mgnify:CR=1 FL=1